MDISKQTTVELSAEELNQAVIEWINLHSIDAVNLTDGVATTSFRAENGECLSDGVTVVVCE